MTVPIRLSIIVVFHNMKREAARTLYTLSADYQKGVDPNQYEVIVIDHGSKLPLDLASVQSFGNNFHYHFHSTSSVSPVACINERVRNCRGDAVMVMIDGAHMLTPGVIGKALRLFAAYEDPFISVVGFHLGPGIQNQTVSQGYDQEVEDRLLAGVDWRNNGYELFRIGEGLSYDCAGWFGPLMESNCFFVRRETFCRVGGFDERFREPGGGLAILDFYQTLVSDPRQDYLVLLGEGSFHQFHGGVASNAPFAEHPWQRFHVEYEKLKGRPFEIVVRRPLLFGDIPPEAVAWTRLCARVGLDWWEQRGRHGAKISTATFGYALQAARQKEEPEVGDLKQRLYDLQQRFDILARRCRECEEQLTRCRSNGGWRGVWHRLCSAAAGRRPGKRKS